VSDNEVLKVGSGEAMVDKANFGNRESIFDFGHTAIHMHVTKYTL